MRWLALLVALLVPIAGGADGYLSPRDAGAPRWLGMNLTELRDYQPQRPFVNVARNARPWMAHRTGQWGGFEHADLRRLGAVDARGLATFLSQKARRRWPA